MTMAYLMAAMTVDLMAASMAMIEVEHLVAMKANSMADQMVGLSAVQREMIVVADWAMTTAYLMADRKVE